MKSFMEEFYYSRINPYAYSDSVDSSPFPFEEKISNLKSHFKEKLSEDDFKRLEVFVHQHECASTVEKKKVFEYGFSMGILLMLDVLNIKENTQLND